MYYLEPLSLTTSKNSTKIQGIQRLLTLDIPTIKLPFVTSSSLFLEYLSTRSVPSKAWSELGHIFATIAMDGTATLRVSAYEANNLELSFASTNTTNIGSFDSFRRILEFNCKLLASKVINPSRVEVRFIIHSYYKSIKCGTLINDSNNLTIEAILGEHTKALQVEGIQPDIYSAPLNISPFCITQLGDHQLIYKATRSGIKAIQNRQLPLKDPVLDKLQLKKLASWSRLIFKKYGPHTLHFAVLSTGELIIQNLITKKEAL